MTRCHRAFAAAVTILAVVANSGVGSAEDLSAESGNRALATALESAWNTHDMDVAFRKLLTKDVDWVNVNAGHGKGIEPVVQGHARVHAGKFKDSVMTIKNVEVTALKSDVALVYVSWEMRGDRNDDGTPREPREGLFTWVTVKEGDVWKIRASTNVNKTPVR
jgi:uncharacterized protein (TIGR02246 family)